MTESKKRTQLDFWPHFGIGDYFEILTQEGRRFQCILNDKCERFIEIRDVRILTYSKLSESSGKEEFHWKEFSSFLMIATSSISTIHRLDKGFEE